MSENPIIEVKNLSKHYQLGNIDLSTFWDDCKKFGKKLVSHLNHRVQKPFHSLEQGFL